MKMDRSRRDANILLDVALELGQTLDLDRLLPLVLRRATELLEAERALFAIYDLNGDLERAVVHNLEWAGPGHALPVSHGLIRRVIDHDKIVLIPDAKTDARFQNRGSVQELDVRFMVGVPVHFEGRVGAVMCLDSRSASADLPPEDLELLDGLARLVGTVVETARLYEEQRFRAVLLDAMINDFRTPLSVISVNAELLGQVSDPHSPEAHQMASDIAASAQRMAYMVEHALELAQVESGDSRPSPTSFDIFTELPRHLQTIEVMARPLDIKLEPAIPLGLAPVITIPDWFWIALDTLLFEAMKNAFRGTTIRIAASEREDRGPGEALARPRPVQFSLFRRSRSLKPSSTAPFIELRLEVQGPPIPSEVVHVLFNGLGRLSKNPRKLRGRLGLTVVEQCVRQLGGILWLQSEGELTQFALSLPTEVEPEDR